MCNELDFLIWSFHVAQRGKAQITDVGKLISGHRLKCGWPNDQQHERVALGLDCATDTRLLVMLASSLCSPPDQARITK